MNRTSGIRWVNTVTYCKRCKSAIYWDDFASPQMLQLGNRNVFHCMEAGCKLISMEVPGQCCGMEELDLVRLGLEGIGIDEEEARNLALKLNRTSAAA